MPTLDKYETDQRGLLLLRASRARLRRKLARLKKDDEGSNTPLIAELSERIRRLGTLIAKRSAGGTTDDD